MRNPYSPAKANDLPLFAPRPHFDGATYDPDLDHRRLNRQLDAVRLVMRCGQWLTLAEIAAKAGCGEASASARLRDLRKDKFGAYDIRRQRRGEGGVFVYRLVTPESVKEEVES